LKSVSKLPLLLSLAFAAGTFSGAQTLKGVYSLQGKTAKTDGHLIVTSVAGKPLAKTLDFWTTEPGKALPMKDYEVEMTKKMHVVIVSNDFKYFIHSHPELNMKTGHLLLTQEFPVAGTYQIYSDGIPNNLPDHQVFRYEVNVGKPSPADRKGKPSGRSVNVGPYEVDLSAVRLQSQKMNMLDINILNIKDGKPATDLHPYLGSPAHAVFLSENDLSYVHAHPMKAGEMMDMSKVPPPMPEGGPSPADMMLHLSLYEPGTYEMWLQFRGGKELYVAKFNITVM
jgi:hypothetical protein